MADVKLIRTGRKTDQGPIGGTYEVTERAHWTPVDQDGISLEAYGFQGSYRLVTVEEPLQDAGNDSDYYAASFLSGAVAYDAPHLEV